MAAAAAKERVEHGSRLGQHTRSTLMVPAKLGTQDNISQAQDDSTSENTLNLPSTLLLDRESWTVQASKAHNSSLHISFKDLSA